MTQKRTTARERLLEAAGDLFYAKGITATGIDTITQSAGVAKMSLYNNFSSKADLVAAYVAERDLTWMALYERRAAKATSPKERILAVVDAYADHADREASTHGFKGCGMFNAAAELDADSPVRAAIKRHKDGVKGSLEKHILEIRTATAGQASELAEMFSFILEGAMVRSGLDGNSDKIRTARKIIADILDDKFPASAQFNA
ncbi:TetR/AcrR family transcriptional regulator [Pseudodesulfovibrio sp.]|uniref:TetR/AcrR family transcriptional regulator n=1 Tax=unclassified Pseudodesulfovibrio TaxID=2661612 RepID=UPI003B00A118